MRITLHSTAVACIVYPYSCLDLIVNKISRSNSEKLPETFDAVECYYVSIFGSRDRQRSSGFFGLTSTIFVVICIRKNAVKYAALLLELDNSTVAITLIIKIKICEENEATLLFAAPVD